VAQLAFGAFAVTREAVVEVTGLEPTAPVVVVPVSDRRVPDEHAPNTHTTSAINAHR
jgi:hypothetical protein